MGFCNIEQAISTAVLNMVFIFGIILNLVRYCLPKPGRCRYWLSRETWRASITLFTQIWSFMPIPVGVSHGFPEFLERPTWLCVHTAVPLSRERYRHGYRQATKYACCRSRIFYVSPQKNCILERETAEKRLNNGTLVRAAVAQRIIPLVHKDACLGPAVSEPLLRQKRLA